MKKVITKNEYNIRFELIDTFQSKKFMYEIEKISDDLSLIHI